MFRWELLGAGAAGAWAVVMVFLGDSSNDSYDSMQVRITLYVPRDFNYESNAGNTTLLMTTGRTFLTISLTRPLSSGAGAVEKSRGAESIL